METGKTLYYLSTLHQLSGAPIIYSDLNGNLHHYQPFQLDGPENSLSFIAERLKKVLKKNGKDHAMYLLHPCMVILGIVINPHTGEFVFIGPMALPGSKAEEIDDYLFETGLPPESTKKLAAYMNGSKSWSLDKLKVLLVNIDLILNDEILAAEELIALNDPETKVRTAFVKNRLQKEPDTGLRDTHSAEEYIAKLNYCVENGDLIGLAEQIMQMGAFPYTEPTTVNLREEKINAFGSIYALENVAMRSGIPGTNMETTKKYYLTRIDDAPNVDVVHQLIISAMFDFTKHVKSYLADKTDDPTATRIIAYIKENINSRLICEEIAAALHITPNYLFTRFKEATGQTVNAYIQKEKIKKACYYMMFTEKTSAEIAAHLSFSSQNYYQAVFKKVMGQTPREWRNSNKLI